MHRHFFFAFVLASMVALSATAQTLDLASRTFWLGERPATMEVDSPFVALGRIDWIEDILQDDPVLGSAVVHIEQEYISPENSVAASVAWRRPGEVLLGSDHVPPQFVLPDYQIYGLTKFPNPDLVYVPVDPAAGFKVSCGRRQDDKSLLSGCTIYATYPPDDHIRLKARLYFSPDPVDAPTKFRDVVERMREVAYCLDVTEKLVDVPKVYPDLKDCRQGK